MPTEFFEPSADGPTAEAYGELYVAFEHFNRAMFDAQLPPCLITLQRRKGTYGYFSKGRFVRRGTGDMVDEIALNPAYFASQTIKNTLSTLVHEQVHQWQRHFGSFSRRGYHNKEWADKMESIGLIPSDTGKPGGRKTGQQMDHYIEPGGVFDLACDSLLTREFTLSWLDRFPAERLPVGPTPVATAAPPATPDALTTEPAITSTAYLGLGRAESVLALPSGDPVNRSNRVKYRCATCLAQVWGKPNLKLRCGVSMCRNAPFEECDATAQCP
ncbi:SprT-like domain-containing protein [Bordetella bronchiseptica]|uniref:SprT-like domain-containing protein n=1 Tax=Bordetella bronchiseptica TaxID=518 RepID=UPI003F747CC8